MTPFSSLLSAEKPSGSESEGFLSRLSSSGPALPEFLGRIVGLDHDFVKRH
jgi:hypothetical protein